MNSFLTKKKDNASFDEVLFIVPKNTQQNKWYAIKLLGKFVEGDYPEIGVLDVIEELHLLKLRDFQTYENALYGMMYEARTEVEGLAKIIEEDFLVLGRMGSIMKPEWAIPSEFSGILLNKTNSSQRSTPNGVVNKSKGRGYDVETRDIVRANKLFNMPYVMDDVIL